MKHFKFETAASWNEASQALASREEKGRKAIIAGGTDLLGGMKDSIFMDYPAALISLGEIKNAAYIKDEGDSYRIGAMTKLVDIAENADLKEELAILPEAARSVASPLIRNRATIAGNLCQDVRCWFYRYPNHGGGRLECMRKGGCECFAIKGDNRYHSIYGGMKVAETPCQIECPACTDIPAYMARLRAGDVKGAAEILLQANPLPMMTSRVCAHTCQSKCNRCDTDQGVSIHAVERMVGDYILDHLDEYYKAPAKASGKTVGIVGAGPAGLTAAYYLRKAGHEVTVYDALDEPGGCLMYAIPNYRLPKHYVRTLTEAYKKMGVRFVCGAKLGEKVQISELEKQFDKLFIATGAWSRPVLGFDGEEFTEFGLQFLIDVNKWVNKKERKHVLVVGGGNVSMDVAITAKRLGAESVTMACLEQRWEMPASPEEIARAEEEGIKVMPGWGVSRALYEGKTLKGLELKRCTHVKDETGRFNPQYDENDKMSIEADSVLMAAGQKVDLSFIEKEYELAKNRNLIQIEKDTQQTSRPNVYAGGDATTGPKTVVLAIRSGRNAAEAINAAFGIKNPPKYGQEGFIHFADGCAKLNEAAKDHELSMSERSLDKEDSTTFSLEEAAKEASRCMNCGCYSVNASDLSPVMVALGATLKTTKKEIPAADFFCTKLKAYDNLEPDEIITEISVPKLSGYVTQYQKFRMRDSIDFAMTSMASAYKLEGGEIADVRIVLGGVAPVPIRATAVEELLKGQKPSDNLAKAAAELAVKDAAGIGHNEYKVDEVKAFVSRLVSSMK